MSKDKAVVALALSGMKKEQEKKTSLFEHGVDLANYQNGFYNVAIDMLVHLVGANKKVVREYIEWWLLENGQEVLVDDVNLCVKDASSFTDFLFTLE